MNAPVTADPDAINRPIYLSPGIERGYLHLELDPPEALALLTVVSRYPHRDVLDIGVGAGRTARYLFPLAARYVAIDYSPVMVDHVHRALPGVDVQVADMRDLMVFSSSSFDLVFGSCNVVDAVSATDRQRVLAEVHRVLKPQGIFLFSSHNRTYAHALSGPRLSISNNPVTQLRHAANYLRQLVNHQRIKRYRRQEPDYALLNDVGHNFSMLHYYVALPAQQQQLERAGFSMVSAIDNALRFVAATDDCSASPYLHYIARRLA